MILTKGNTIILCLFLLLLILTSVFCKEVLYYTKEEFCEGGVDGSDCTTDPVEVKAVSARTYDVYTCIHRYNRLLEAYVSSLNAVSDVRKNLNMEHAFADGSMCPKSYSASDEVYFTNIAFDEHYLNWLNINILRSFGARTCNDCSMVLGGNLNNDKSMDKVDKDGVVKSPRLWSLHYIGLYDTTNSTIDFPGQSDDNFHVEPITNIKKFYINLEEKKHLQYGSPVKIYFGIKKFGNVYMAYTPKLTGLAGLNKLVQGCAISGTNGVTATLLENHSAHMTTEGPPAGTANEDRGAKYIDPSFFDIITGDDYRGSATEISVFGFFTL